MHTPAAVCSAVYHPAVYSVSQNLILPSKYPNRPGYVLDTPTAAGMADPLTLRSYPPVPSGSKDGTIRIWDISSGVCIQVFQKFPKNRLYRYSCRYTSRILITVLEYSELWLHSYICNVHCTPYLLARTGRQMYSTYTVFMWRYCTFV